MQNSRNQFQDYFIKSSSKKQIILDSIFRQQYPKPYLMWFSRFHAVVYEYVYSVYSGFIMQLDKLKTKTLMSPNNILWMNVMCAFPYNCIFARYVSNTRRRKYFCTQLYHFYEWPSSLNSFSTNAHTGP